MNGGCVTKINNINNQNFTPVLEQQTLIEPIGTSQSLVLQGKSHYSQASNKAYLLSKQKERSLFYESHLTSDSILSKFSSLLMPPKRQLCQDNQEDNLHYLNSALAFTSRQKTNCPEEPSFWTQAGYAALSIVLFPLALTGCADASEDSDEYYPDYDDNEQTHPINADKDNDGYCSDIALSTCYSKDKPEDCNDFDSDIHPYAKETRSDGIDQNCNGMKDEDLDQDGYSIAEFDCNDEDASFFPGTGCDFTPGADICDHDKDGYPKLQCKSYYDVADCDDEDPEKYPGHGGCSIDVCDVDKDGYLSDKCIGGDDCNDKSKFIHPGAKEIDNNGVDMDCDGKDNAPIDKIDLSVCDKDNDGYLWVNCKNGTDCDDNNKDVNPGSSKVEYCGSTQDFNCDGKTDSDCCLPDSGVIELPVQSAPNSWWFQSCDYIEGHKKDLVCFDKDGDVDLFSFKAISSGEYTIMRSDCKPGPNTMSTCVYKVNEFGNKLGQETCNTTYVTVEKGQTYRIKATGSYGPYGIAVRTLP